MQPTSEGAAGFERSNPRPGQLPRTWSRLDYERFGFGVAKLDDFRSETPAQALERLRGDGVKLVISRVDAADARLVRDLQQNGFEYMDSQLGYGMSARQAAAVPLSARAGAELGGPQDSAALCQIAAIVFEGFGHYFANPRLDRDRCREIYVDWTNRTLTDTEFADKAFVYRHEGRAVALFCAKMVGEGEGKYVRGGMGFVAPAFQREGVFKRLVAAAVCWAGEEGVGLDRNLVHSTNYPVNAVFTRLGFKLTSHWMTFHRWLG